MGGHHKKKIPRLESEAGKVNGAGNFPNSRSDGMVVGRRLPCHGTVGLFIFGMVGQRVATEKLNLLGLQSRNGRNHL